MGFMEDMIDAAVELGEGLVEKIINRSFRRLTSAGTTETLIESEGHLGALLRDTFGLELSTAERAAIWRRLVERAARP